MLTINASSSGSRAAQRILSRSSIVRSSVVLSYGVGLVAFMVALAIRFSFDETLPPGFPFVTFFPAVIISAFLGGSRSGLLCAALSFLAAWYWFIDRPDPLLFSNGAAVALGFFTFVVAVDISIIEAVSRTLDRLAAQEAQLKTIVETVPLGIVMAEFPSGRIVGGNEYIERKFGHPVRYSPDIHSYGEWVGYHEDGSRVDGYEYPLAAMMLRGEENPSIDVQNEREDGSKAWVRLLGRPVRDVAGKMIGGVVAIIDIDEQRKTQIALTEALNAKEILLYEVNHRVKNSLNLVTSFLLLEASRIDNIEGRSAVMAARSKVDLIARLHHDLYTSGSHDNIDLKIAVENIARDLLLSAGRDDVELEFVFIGDPMISIRQASPLVLTINEVITNSLKYGLSAEHPKLTISAVAANDELTLVISDNGPGISVTESKNKPGTGSEIIQGLVTQMRGKFERKSNGSGTSVVLTIGIKTQSDARIGKSL